jgi:Xaa-Pro aminopeptidase
VLAACAGALRAQIPVTEYAARRDSLAARLDSGVVVAYGARRAVSEFAAFAQLPAFHYLTNYHEPDAAFVMVVRGRRGSPTLFVTPSGARRAFYDGERPDSATLRRSIGLVARDIAALPAVLDSLARTRLPFYTLADFESGDYAAADTLTRGRAAMAALAARHPGLVVRDAHPIVDDLRARKSPAELALIRRAAEITSEAFVDVMRAPQATKEYELQAVLEYTFKRRGASRPAYGSIVGAGQNGTVLHYMRDSGDVRPGDLVVMDAGAEYRGYAADVTRTIPIGGTFTPAQRAIYQLVRDAQAAAERNSKPGMSAAAAHDSSFDVRARGLAALGLVDSVGARLDLPWPADCERRPRTCTQAMFWMVHGISHGIGLEVHDPAQFYTGDGTFKVGDAFTIEPGIYVSARMLAALPDTPRNRAFVARVRPAVARYENTGVRIEDDYVITARGLERISSAPREIDEIEATMRRRPPRTVP